MIPQFFIRCLSTTHYQMHHTQQKKFYFICINSIFCLHIFHNVINIFHTRIIDACCVWLYLKSCLSHICAINQNFLFVLLHTHQTAVDVFVVVHYNAWYTLELHTHCSSHHAWTWALIEIENMGKTTKHAHIILPFSKKQC